MREALSNLAYAGGRGEFVRPATAPGPAALAFELAVIGFAILGLIAAELMLSSVIRGTNFAGGDGKFAQAIIHAAYKFGGFFHFNNINPLQGLGSQLLPINVWINPSSWPFAILDSQLAPDASAALALGIFALACYVMARCFDVPIVPSAIAAQLSIVLFAPTVFLLELSTVFSLMVGNAVVYAPYMIAIGLLARLEPGSWRSFILITAGIFALLMYSLSCDPLWSVVSASSWALPFAIVALSPMRPKAVLIRCAALGCCVILLGVSGAAEYLYTLALYTSRLQFPALADRLRMPDFQASTLFYSPYMKYFYLAWAAGWLLGLLTLCGRARMLTIVGILSCGGLLAEILVYLLLQDTPWSLPLPVYVEQSLFPLFQVSAVAGYWGALRAAAGTLRPSYVTRGLLLFRSYKAEAASAFIVVAVVPVAVVHYALSRPAHIIDLYNEPWPNETEFVQLLSHNTAQAVGRPFRGATLLWNDIYADHLTNANLWIRGVPTISEYSQLVTPQSVYFNQTVLKNDGRGRLNRFYPVIFNATAFVDRKVFFNVLQMLGARYYVVGDEGNPGATTISRWVDPMDYSIALVPQGAHQGAGPAAHWHIYELPHPNVGDYSPTMAVAAETGATAAAMMTRPDFDFIKQVVLSTAMDTSLVPARNMQMSLIRGGLHVSGHSDGTSLLVLPQQFSHCLRARDERVRLVRANLMVTGVIFSGEIDTDIISDYGLFTSRCRWADISDIKKFEMQIDARVVPLSGEGLFPNWEASMAKLGAAVRAIK
jgi:hypothetical protein